MLRPVKAQDGDGTVVEAPVEPADPPPGQDDTEPARGTEPEQDEALIEVVVEVAGVVAAVEPAATGVAPA